MKIYSVYDEEFRPYGKVLEGYDTKALTETMESFPLPEKGTAYRPGVPELEALDIFDKFGTRAFGGMPVQLGMCWGHNRKLNCLEYHRDSEINVGSSDFILLLAKEDEIINGKLDTAKVKAFRVPAGIAVEVYATTLHYAPIETSDSGFYTAVVLPKGTNTEYELETAVSEEDKMLWARNKWLIAHPDTDEAKEGAFVGLEGVNIKL